MGVRHPIDCLEETSMRAALAATLLAVGLSAGTEAKAAEAVARPAALLPEARIGERLARDGYELVGIPTRKGDLVVLSATRTGTVWRLVIDPRTGGIIGLRPLGSSLPFQP
jgi:hypothetical protein